MTGRNTGVVTAGIVGAGPAGLVIAHLLQRAGIPFVLLERHRQADVAGRPKAGLIEYRTVQLLREAGLAGSIVDFSVPNHRCEFRTPGESAVIDYSTLTGGRPHYIYPQHQLVGKLAGALTGVGADIRWAHTVHEVSPQADGVVLSGTGGDGARFEIRCEIAVGCEGSHSAVAAAMTDARVTEQLLPVRWLSLIGAAPPLENHTVYAAHPAGFAGQMRRGPAQTRYYLEVPGTDTAADWPQQRIRAELASRLAVPRQLDAVPFGELMVLDLRVRVIEPMQQGRLFLAGDAAHLITPAGGKGMNLAIQDAVELGRSLIDRYGPDADGGRLAAYSQRRLAGVWRTQAFSSWFLHVILASLRDGDESRSAVPGGFARGLRNGWVQALQDDPLLARWFAHAYAGVDQE
jgi:p-hydroxybenzoate 3-monooxygenase